MVAEDDILELRLTGDGINPTSVKARDFAELIKSLDEALLHISKRSNREISENDLFISVVGIENRSLGILSKPSIAGIIVASFLQLTSSIENDKYEALPNKSIESLQAISRFVRRNNCVAEFKVNNETKASISPDTKIQVPKESYLIGETTIYPIVTRVGGVHPKIAIKVSDLKTIYIPTHERFAKQLGERLYEKVGIAGQATWDKDTFEIVDFKITEVLDYHSITSFDEFLEVTKNLSKHWEDVSDVNKFIMRDDE